MIETSWFVAALAGAAHRPPHDPLAMGGWADHGSSLLLALAIVALLAARGSRARRRRAWYRAVYLRSAHWRARRARAITRAGYRCERCRARGRLEVHHRTYRRLGRERDRDLQALCATCHDRAERARRRASTRWP